MDPPHFALRFDAVDLDREPNQVLHGLDWEVSPAERWVVLGPNGSGKTTILQLASGYLHPTRGSVDILGHRLGRVDVRRLRERIGVVSAAIAKMLVAELSAADVVISGRHGALEPWWDRYSPEEHERAAELLRAAGFAAIGHRPFGVLSEGERQQVLLARTLMASPELLLLDEPCAGLDIAGRERLLARLADLATQATGPPMVLVTHHVEEIPVAFTHVLLLREGQVVSAGAIDEHLRSDTLSACFGMSLKLRFEEGRWSCRAA